MPVVLRQFQGVEQPGIQPFRRISRYPVGLGQLVCRLKVDLVVLKHHVGKLCEKGRRIRSQLLPQLDCLQCADIEGRQHVDEFSGAPCLHICRAKLLALLLADARHFRDTRWVLIQHLQRLRSERVINPLRKDAPDPGNHSRGEIGHDAALVRADNFLIGLHLKLEPIAGVLFPVPDHIDFHACHRGQEVPHHFNAAQAIALRVQHLLIRLEQSDHVAAVPRLLQPFGIEQAAETAFHLFEPPSCWRGCLYEKPLIPYPGPALRFCFPVIPPACSLK